jgi:hypothetical protein
MQTLMNISLFQVSEEAADVIVTKAIELWQMYGSFLSPGAGPDGIKTHSKRP